MDNNEITKFSNKVKPTTESISNIIEIPVVASNEFKEQQYPQQDSLPEDNA